MRDWKNIPLPEKMQHMEVDERGFPVPFIVLRDKEGKPKFTANDTVKVAFCRTKKMCAICGKAMFKDMWVAGGVLSAFHPQGVYIDTPVHRECGEYALQVCPYLAFTAYNGKVDIKKLQAKADGVILVDPTVMSNRPPMFVFAKISGFAVQGFNHAIVPVKPFLDIEFWNDGKKLSLDVAENILKEKAGIDKKFVIDKKGVCKEV